MLERVRNVKSLKRYYSENRVQIKERFKNFGQSYAASYLVGLGFRTLVNLLNPNDTQLANSLLQNDELLRGLVGYTCMYALGRFLKSEFLQKYAGPGDKGKYLRPAAAIASVAFEILQHTNPLPNYLLEKMLINTDSTLLGFVEDEFIDWSVISLYKDSGEKNIVEILKENMREVYKKGRRK